MAFRVKQTAEADRDLDQILDWLLAEEAGETGLRCFQKLHEAMSSLSEFSQRCPFAPENASVTFELRQLLFGKKPHVYRILFPIEDDVVYVLHIRHGRRRRLGEPL